MAQATAHALVLPFLGPLPLHAERAPVQPRAFLRQCRPYVLFNECVRVRVVSYVVQLIYAYVAHVV